MAEKHSFNAELYKALENDETEIVSQMSEEVDEHGLHILTILDSTVLHMATYANKSELVLRLLQELPNRHLDKLTSQNQLGDTILHMTAISNSKTHEVERKLLEKAPGLLCPSKPVLHKYSGNSKTEKKVADGDPKSFRGQGEGATKTPLFLATISGCVQIVEEILNLYPQAVVHIDDKGRNILRVAIKYRQLKILKLVMKMKLPMNWLVGKLDEEGNSILHTVGKKKGLCA
nr:hypothetical protein CFP56_54273 [Quercus suber]